MRVTKRLDIGAPADQVWHVLADFGNIHEWSPVVKHSELAGEVESGLDCARTCVIPGFGEITERVTRWDEGHSISLAVDRMPMMKGMESVWRVIPGSNGSTVEAQIDYKPGMGWFGPLLGATMMRAMMARQLGRSLQGLKDYVERVPAAT